MAWGLATPLLCPRVSESCDVVGSLHLLIFVKNLSKRKPLSREVVLLCTELCRGSLNRSDWDWADTAGPVSAQSFTAQWSLYVPSV